MKLVIDIPEQDYKDIREYYDTHEIVASTYSWIYHGIPLPKGHGRLIDGDYLYNKFVANKCPDSLVLMFIKDEPTVIEADKGEQE